MKTLSFFLIFSFFIVNICNTSHAQTPAYQHKKYLELKQSLKRGWGTYNTRNALSQVLLPYGFEISMNFKYQGTNFGGYLGEAQITGADHWRDAKIQPKAHAIDGSYVEMTLNWKDVKVKIQTATQNDELFVLISPIGEQKYPSQVIVKSGILWNKPGTLGREGETLVAKLPGRTVQVFPAGETIEEYNVSALTPYFCMSANQPAAFSTGKKHSIEQIREIIETSRKEFRAHTARYGDELQPAYTAIVTVLGFQTIYEPVHERIVSTVGRTWNVKRGGYSFFGWDNFFLAYLSALDSKELAFANIIEHLHDKTGEGFIPNCSQGNGRKTWDRSQPPVGALMVKEIYKRYPEKWFIEATFDELLEWNRWWITRRQNGELLSWGSHPSKNPFNDRRHHDAGAASLETGLDDSPMYEDVPFDKEKSVMKLHDVGLNGLYIADCEALAEMARLIGRKKEARELEKRAKTFRKNAKTLWNDEFGMFLNRRTDTQEFSKRLSPTLFYALLGKVASPEQARRMIDEHFFNENEFWGQWVLPSIARNDPAFEQQKYWKGAIWAPLNFLTYLSLKQYDLPKAQKELSEKSLKLFVKEWERKGFISENYSAITGTGDDERIKSVRFYAWGALLGMIPMMEQGHMPDPSKTIGQ